MKEQIGQRLKKIVKDKGISNVEIIKETGISKNILSNYYKGEIPNNIITLAKISRILGTSLDYIIYGDETVNFTNKQIMELLQYYNQLDNINKKLAISELKHMVEVQELKKNTN